MAKFSEYDVVRANDGIDGLEAGKTGTILLVLKDSPAVYEVEFFEADGASLGTFTANEDQLLLADRTK